MPEFGYSFVAYDPSSHIRASGRELDVSPKKTREVLVAIKGMKVGRAKSLLEAVIEKKQAIAFRRYKQERGHKRSLFKFHAGGYPVKAASKVLDVLKNLEANAEFRGIDVERLVIVNASSHRGTKVKGYTPRAFGRSSPSFNTLTHIELVAKEE